MVPTSRTSAENTLKPVATPGPAAYDTVAAARSTKKRMPAGALLRLSQTP